MRRSRRAGDPVSRPRLAIGTFGDINVIRTHSGRHTARARYRDWDGKTRLVEATADTGTAATRALKQKSRRRPFASAWPE